MPTHSVPHGRAVGPLLGAFFAIVLVQATEPPAAAAQERAANWHQAAVLAQDTLYAPSKTFGFRRHVLTVDEYSSVRADYRRGRALVHFGQHPIRSATGLESHSAEGAWERVVRRLRINGVPATLVVGESHAGYREVRFRRGSRSLSIQNLYCLPTERRRDCVRLGLGTAKVPFRTLVAFGRSLRPVTP